MKALISVISCLFLILYCLWMGLILAIDGSLQYVSSFIPAIVLGILLFNYRKQPDKKELQWLIYILWAVLLGIGGYFYYLLMQVSWI